MEITFKLFASLSDYLPATARRTNALSLDVADGCSVASVIDSWALPPRLVHLVLVNGEFIPPHLRAERAWRRATCWRSGRRSPAAEPWCPFHDEPDASRVRAPIAAAVDRLVVEQPAQAGASASRAQRGHFLPAAAGAAARRLQLPRLDVSIAFTGGNADQEAAFIDDFLRHFRRGGG
jgi:hypothetical protein